MKKGKVKKMEVRYLTIAIIVVILVTALVLVFLNKKDTASNDNTVNSIKSALSSKEKLIVYVENSDSKKCEKCESINNYLKDSNIKYITYDVNLSDEKDYDKLLKDLGVNKNDFAYPAIIYISDGIMYSNIINIDNTKAVDQYIKEYNLKKVK